MQNIENKQDVDIAPQGLKPRYFFLPIGASKLAPFPIHPPDSPLPIHASQFPLQKFALMQFALARPLLLRLDSGLKVQG